MYNEVEGDRFVAALAGAALRLCVPAAAQDFRGRINGTVTDNTGAVLPGVTVTATSPALIQPQVQVTGQRRLVPLPGAAAGVYTIDFELTGFQTVKREGIRVVINQTLTVDQQLQVATLQETVTVTGESPVVDTTTTTMGTNFTKELLTEIPNARDVWAAMAQAPGIQMTAYDVGGSRTGNQTGYRTYGMDDQNQTAHRRHRHHRGHRRQRRLLRLRQLRGVPGRRRRRGRLGLRRRRGAQHQRQVGRRPVLGQLVQRLPERGHDRQQRPRLPAGGQRRRTRTATSRRTPLARGNQIQKQYDLNGNIGGPLWRGKAWGFFSYRLNDQYTYITGLPSNIERSKLTNPYTFKGTYQLDPEQPADRLHQQARRSCRTSATSA